ncbi:hypothetical protein N9948_02050 [bacterium]|nr:hypothetical protein [bacterium]
MAKKKVTKKKKSTRKSSEVIENFNPFSNGFQTITYKAEVYAKVSDLLLDFAELYGSNRCYNEHFVFNNLGEVFDASESDFWNDESLKDLHKIITEKSASLSNSWFIAESFIAMLKSNKCEDFKFRSIRGLKTMPTALYNHILKDKKVSEDIKAEVLQKYDTKKDVAIDVILKGDSKRLSSIAVRSLNVGTIDCPDLLSVIAISSNCDRQQREDAIAKITNTDFLQKIVFESNDFDMIKKARTRIKELPNSLKFICNDKAS